MRKLILPQNSMHAGEITPNAYSRDDLAIYGSALKKLENWNILLEGGVERRAGSEWIAVLIGEPRLFSFEFNEDQQYIFALTNTRLDIWSVDDSDPDELPTVTFVETITTNADWTTALLDTLHVSHSGDTMFVADGTGSQIMKEIRRTSAVTFAISDFAFEEPAAGFPRYQPYLKFADNPVTMTPSGTTGGINCTLSEAFWTADHVGVIIRHQDTVSDTYKEILINSITSPTVAACTVRETLDGTTETTSWDEAVFSTANGWQREVKLAENRLIIGGSRDFPHGNWLSNTSAFFRFEEGSGDDNQMIDRPIDSGKIEQVRGINVNDNIEIYTDQGEHYIPLSETQVLSPQTASIRAQDKNGINAKVPPITYDGATIFIQRTGMAMREFIFSSVDEKFASPPVSLLATHLFQKKDQFGAEQPADIRRSTVLNGTTRRPEGYYFTVNVGTGEIIGFHSIRDEKIAGFMRWSTDGEFHDVAAVGNQLFTAVKRPVAGDVWDEAFADDFGRAATIYHLERSEQSFSLDQARRATNIVPGKVFTGFGHLINQTVHVVSRGAVYHGEFMVAADGSITIDEDETEIVAGRDYNVSMKTLRPRFTVNGFSISGKIKRLINIVIELSATFSLTIAGANKILIRKVTDDMSLDPVGVQGLREFPLRGYSRDAEVELTQGEPLPCKVLGFQLTIGV